MMRIFTHIALMTILLVPGATFAQVNDASSSPEAAAAPTAASSTEKKQVVSRKRWSVGKNCLRPSSKSCAIP